MGTIPKYLYKYRTWSDMFHRRILTASEVFFSSARAFNDPFECSLYPTYESFSEKEVFDTYVKHIAEGNPKWTPDQINLEAGTWADKGILQNPESLRLALDRNLEMKYEKFGILTLSELPDNQLMWSHYAESHKGFCVGFDAEMLEAEFERLFHKYGIIIFRKPVEYVSSFKPFDAKDTSDEDYVTKQIVTKDARWSYEKEHRCILIDKINVAISIDKKVISKIILGCKISDNHKCDIIGIVKTHDLHVEIVQCRMRENSFELDMISIN